MRRIDLSSGQFRNRVRGIVLATWLLTPLAGTAMLSFLGIYPLGDLVFALTNVSLVYWIAFMAVAVWHLDRRAASIVARVEQPSEGSPDAEGARGCVRRLVRDYLLLLAVFCLLAPLSVEISLFTFQGRAILPGSYLLGVAGIVPLMLIVAFPAFFYLGDTLGAYAAPRGVQMKLLPLRTRVMVLGLVIPALIDITLLLYFHDRTGYLTVETVFLWGGLIALAGCGALLAWISLARSLEPLEAPLRALESAYPNLSADEVVRPASLDELGAIANGWQRLLERDRQQESRFRDLVEGSIQGMFVIQGMRIVFANMAFVKMMGYRTTDEIYELADASVFVAEEDRARIMEYSKARHEGRDVPDRYELRAVRADGSQIWQEANARSVQWDGVPALQVTVIDITERKRAEEALRLSEKNLMNAQRIARVGSFERDIVNEKLTWSDQVYTILGIDPEDGPPGKETFVQMVHPDDRKRVAESADAMVREGGMCQIDYRIIRPDGELRAIHMEAETTVDEAGCPARMAGTVQDVTELRRTEQALRDSEASLQNAQRIARMGSWDWYIVEGVLHWSEEIYRIFGVEPNAFPATYEAFLGYIHPDDRTLVEDAARQAFAGEKPYSIDHRILLADGSMKYVHEQGEVIRDSSGQPVKMSGAVHDVSELHFAEAALRKSENSLRHAQRIARIGSWERDIRTGLLYWSDEMYNLLGVKKGEVEPSLERLMELVHPDDVDTLRVAIEEAIAGTSPYKMDFRIIRPDGNETIVHAQGEVDRDSVGDPVRFRGTAQDVTELRKAEAEVRRLNEELEMRVEDRTMKLREAQAELLKKSRLATLGQLTATVSHELRNPLGTMRTSAYVLAKSLPDGTEETMKAIARIDRGISRCDRIIDELLDFTRSTEIDREPVTVDGWLRAVLSEMSVPVGVKLETELRLGNLAAMFDSGRMRRTIINVVDNASQAITGQPGWDARTSKGKVTVSTVKSNGNIEFRVADNGPGIPADIMEKIFEPLFSTKSFGVGLGLPTVRQILEQHGGSVMVESEPGAGTRFRLVFPLMEPETGQKPGVGNCFPAPVDKA